MQTKRAHPGRVILTYGRSLMALVIARSLAERGVEVIGCDDVGLTVLSFSNSVRETFTVASWERDPERFLEDLESAALEYAPSDDRPYVLMPVFRDMEFIAKHRARFEPLIRVAAPDFASIEQVTPKHHLFALARKQGLCAPETRHPHSLEELEALAADLPYPVIMKPVDGAGGRGVAKIHNAEEALKHGRALGFKPGPLVQDTVPGEDYCVPILARDGAITALMAYRNVKTFPRDAGAGAVRETVDVEPFRAEAEKLAAATNWSGVAQLDFRWSGEPQDKPQLIEVNARFWAGIFHSVESGVDFPWLLYRQTIGEDVAADLAQAEIGSTTRTSGTWLLAAIQDVADSDPHFIAASDAWRQAKRDLRVGDFVHALGQVGKATKETLTIHSALEEMRHSVRSLKRAPSELSAAEDPLVGLGALFVLSSLARHGKLPPEVTYEAEEPVTEVARPRARKRPLIGVTKPEKGDLLPYLAMKFAVWLAGGDSVKVTARAPSDPHTIDGLIFGGGSDVYPARYQGDPKQGYRYDLARGDMEASWAMAARRHDLPVLGVCRGAQMLNVLAGGTLHRDLSGYQDADRAMHFIGQMLRRYKVRLRAGSRLARIFRNRDTLSVNAIHTQAIDRLGAGLKVTARETNGVVQGIEDPHRRFWIGVQFHPELLVYRGRFRGLFRALVEAAHERAQERFSGPEASEESSGGGGALAHEFEQRTADRHGDLRKDALHG